MRWYYLQLVLFFSTLLVDAVGLIAKRLLTYSLNIRLILYSDVIYIIFWIVITLSHFAHLVYSLLVPGFKPFAFSAAFTTLCSLWTLWIGKQFLDRMNSLTSNRSTRGLLHGSISLISTSLGHNNPELLETSLWGWPPTILSLQLQIVHISYSLLYAYLYHILYFPDFCQFCGLTKISQNNTFFEIQFSFLISKFSIILWIPYGYSFRSFISWLYRHFTIFLRIDQYYLKANWILLSLAYSFVFTSKNE